jgi:hypothetical protein
LTEASLVKSGAVKGAARDSVNRIPSALYAPMAKASAKLRSHFDQLRFEVMGWKIVPPSMWEEWDKERKNLCTAFDMAKIALADAADNGQLEEMLKLEIGNAFPELKEKGKIPTGEEIRKSWSYVYDADADDDLLADKNVRKAIGEEAYEELVSTVAKMKGSREERILNDFLSNILTDVQGFLVDAVTRCSRKESKGTMFKTLSTKYEKLLDLERYNTIGDKNLTEVFTAMRAEFGSEISQDGLADNSTYRASVAKAAGIIQFEMLPKLFKKELLESSMASADIVMELEKLREAKALLPKVEPVATVETPVEPVAKVEEPVKKKKGLRI